MAVLTETDPKDKTSLVAKTDDVVTGVPVDNTTAVAAEPPVSASQPAASTTAEDPEQQRASALDMVTAAGNAAQDVISQPYTTQTPQRESTWEDLYRKLKPDPTPTPEDLVAEAKRQKRNATFAALGDFATALSNMGSTIAGAPNQKLADPTPGYTAHMKDIERLRKLREDNQAQWDRGLAREQARDDKAYAQQLTDSQRKLAIEQRDRQAASKLYMSIADALMKADKAEREGDILAAKKLKAEADAAYADARAKGYDRLLNATISQKLASAAASNARAADGGSSGGKTKYTLTVNGTTHTYNSASDYKKAVIAEARKNGIDPETGGGRTIDHIAAEVEERTKRQEQPKPDSGGNKPTSGGKGGKKHLPGW